MGDRRTIARCFCFSVDEGMLEILQHEIDINNLDTAQNNHTKWSRVMPFSIICDRLKEMGPLGIY